MTKLSYLKTFSIVKILTEYN